MDTKLIGNMVFQGQTKIQIVLILDRDTDEMKSWIGCIPPDFKGDSVLYTTDNGAKFPVQEAVFIIAKRGHFLLPEDERVIMLKSSKLAW